MSKISIVAVLAVLVSTGYSASLRERSGGPLHATRGQVVFMGDSITDWFDSEGIETWNQFYAPLGAVNTGVAGDRTTTVIDRINNEGILDSLNAYLAVLKIGTNDLSGGVTVEAIYENIGTILMLIKNKNPHARILLLGVLPRGGEDLAQGVRNVNAVISAYADGASVFFLDMETVFSTGLGVVVPEYYLPDQLHLSVAGYAAWAQAMNPIFDSILNSPFNGKAVFFGDSITQGWGGAGSAIWNENYAGLSSSNFGISGHITSQTIDRIVTEGVLNNLNAKVAVVKIGTNDLGRGIAESEIAANIRIIVDEILARQPHCRVLLLGILPRNGVEIATRAENVNAIIAGFADGDRVRFLNMRDQFQVAIGEVIPELFTDGLHLTAAGYGVWHSTMKQQFDELLQFK